MIIVDVREKDEFLENHVSGAINIPLSNLMNHSDISLSKVQKNDGIIVYCRSGNRSAQAIDILSRQGFTNLINGIDQHSTKKYIDSLNGA